MDDATLRNQIGSNIAAYRKQAGLTQAGLAEKLNYSDKAVSKWERGESLPDVYILSQIADLYGVSVSALIGEIQPPKESFSGASNAVRLWESSQAVQKIRFSARRKSSSTLILYS